MKSGVLLIDKRVGVTSRQEVSFIARKFGIKKAGHVGTLDPFADGVLVVLLGAATKISPFLEVMDKRYVATLKLGQKTDTGDLTGVVIEEKPVPSLREEQIKEALNSLIGKQNQIPPMYSAVKVNGKALYKYAREGKTLFREPREIEIYELNFISYENGELRFSTHVSKGTYVRTLGEDIAEKLGTVGHLTKLTRSKVGRFALINSIPAEEVTENNIVSIDDILGLMETYEVDGDNQKKALNGAVLNIDGKDDLILIKDINGVIAIYKKQSNGVYSCLRGLR